MEHNSNLANATVPAGFAPAQRGGNAIAAGQLNQAARRDASRLDMIDATLEQIVAQLRHNLIQQIEMADRLGGAINSKAETTGGPTPQPDCKLAQIEERLHALRSLLNVQSENNIRLGNLL